MHEHACRAAAGCILGLAQNRVHRLAAGDGQPQTSLPDLVGAFLRGGDAARFDRRAALGNLQMHAERFHRPFRFHRDAKSCEQRNHDDGHAEGPRKLSEKMLHSNTVPIRQIFLLPRHARLCATLRRLRLVQIRIAPETHRVGDDLLGQILLPAFAFPHEPLVQVERALRICGQFAAQVRFERGGGLAVLGGVEHAHTRAKCGVPVGELMRPCELSLDDAFLLRDARLG